MHCDTYADGNVGSVGSIGDEELVLNCFDDVHSKVSECRHVQIYADTANTVELHKNFVVQINNPLIRLSTTTPTFFAMRTLLVSLTIRDR